MKLNPKDGFPGISPVRFMTLLPFGGVKNSWAKDRQKDGSQDMTNDNK